MLKETFKINLLVMRNNTLATTAVHTVVSDISRIIKQTSWNIYIQKIKLGNSITCIKQLLQHCNAFMSLSHSYFSHMVFNKCNLVPCLIRLFYSLKFKVKLTGRCASISLLTQWRLSKFVTIHQKKKTA